MQFQVQTRSKAKKNFISWLLPSIIRQVGLANSKSAVLITLQSDFEDHGVAIPLPGLHMYLVVINSKSTLNELALTLSHEMVHVAQMARGIMKPAPRGATLWAGRLYPKSTPYMDRPWELAAFSRQEIIMRRALEESQ